MESNTFSIGEAFSWAWKAFTARPWFFVGMALLVAVLSIVVASIGDMVGGIIGLLLSVAAVVFQWWLYIGVIRVTLHAYDGKPLAFKQLFSESGITLWHYILGGIVYGLIVLGGTILLIIPGIIWALMFMFYAYFILDKNMGPIEALKASKGITKGYRWKLLGLAILLGLLNFVGMLIVGIGLLVSLPITMLAFVWVYRWLDGKGGAVMQSATEEAPEQLEGAVEPAV